MGMTDRQFDSYQEILLRNLKRAKDEVTASGGSSKELDDLIDSLERQLSRP